jgi:hypothetical protein
MTRLKKGIAYHCNECAKYIPQLPENSPENHVQRYHLKNALELFAAQNIELVHVE